MDVIAVRDLVTERGAIGDQFVVVEDRDVLADTTDVIQHVAPNGRVDLEVATEHLSERGTGNQSVGAIDMPTERLRESNLHHRHDIRTDSILPGEGPGSRSDRAEVLIRATA